MPERPVRLAVDCMGGDVGLPVTLPAAHAFAARNPHVRLLLVGDTAAIQVALQSQPALAHSWYEIVHASEVVAMDDPVEVALRRKKDSSMRVAAHLVKDGRADALVSAGNTGALMAISRYVLKTMDGIDRPAIATEIPNSRHGSTTVLDLGANVACSAEHLLQFAIMGASLVAAMDPQRVPRVGLLNIGEEVIKGNEVVKQAAELLRQSNLNFHGNVEGDDICKGTVDVVVCDGFVGNVALKTMEGVARMIGDMLRQEFRRTPFSMLAAFMAAPVLKRLRARVDHRRYNGAALLGLRGIVIKSHGSADVFAFDHALRKAQDVVRNGLLGRMSGAVGQLQQHAVPVTPAMLDQPLDQPPVR